MTERDARSIYSADVKASLRRSKELHDSTTKALQKHLQIGQWLAALLSVAVVTAVGLVFSGIVETAGKTLIAAQVLLSVVILSSLGAYMFVSWISYLRWREALRDSDRQRSRNLEVIERQRVQEQERHDRFLMDVTEKLLLVEGSEGFGRARNVDMKDLASSVRLFMRLRRDWAPAVEAASSSQKAIGE